jgi:hypothetical protein
MIASLLATFPKKELSIEFKVWLGGQIGKTKYQNTVILATDVRKLIKLQVSALACCKQLKNQNPDGKL